jgi:hypothetical protein
MNCARLGCRSAFQGAMNCAPALCSIAYQVISFMCIIGSGEAGFGAGLGAGDRKGRPYISGSNGD